MERMTSYEAIVKYPKQWVVLVNVRSYELNVTSGEVFLVTDNEDEAFEAARRMENEGSMGEIDLFYGQDNDKKYLGGLFAYA